LFIYAAYGWFTIKNWLDETGSRIPQLVMIVVLVLCLAFQGNFTVEYTAAITTPNSRETSVPWIETNIPDGSKVAIESYSPFTDPDKCEVVGIQTLIQYDPNWYIENDFNYLVFASGMYGRFFLEPDKYPDQVTAYEKLFDDFDLVKQFSDGGYEVKIYRVSD
jgi:hypothetical protein